MYRKRYMQLLGSAAIPQIAYLHDDRDIRVSESLLRDQQRAL